MLLEFERVKTRLFSLNVSKHPKMLHFGRFQTRQSTFLINAHGRVTNLKMVTWERRKNWTGHKIWNEIFHKGQNTSLKHTIF